MDNLIPYNDTYDLGKGLNTLRGSAKGSIFSDIVVEEMSSGTGQTVGFSLDRIESSEKLYRSLGISVDTSGRYGLFSASGKFQFAEQSEYNSHSIFFMLRVSVKNAVKRIKRHTVKPEVLQMLTNGETEQFRRAFGDSYIEGIVTGGEFIALYELTFVDQSSKQSMSAALDASYGGLGAGFDIAARFTHDVSNASKSSNLKVRVFQSGGKGLRIVSDPEEILDRAKQFPELVKDAGGVPYEVITASYETLALPKGPSFVEIDNKRSLLDAYCKEIVDLRRRLSDYKYVMFNPEEFELDLKDAAALAQIQDLAKRLGDLIARYTDHARKCADGTGACEPFTELAGFNLSTLPRRKNVLDVVALYDGPNFTGNAHFLSKGAFGTPQSLGLGNDTVESIKLPDNYKAVLWENPDFGGRNLLLAESCADLSELNFANVLSSLYLTDRNDHRLKPDSPVTPAPTQGGVNPKQILLGQRMGKVSRSLRSV